MNFEHACDKADIYRYFRVCRRSTGQQCSALAQQRHAAASAPLAAGKELCGRFRYFLVKHLLSDLVAPASLINGCNLNQVHPGPRTSSGVLRQDTYVKDFTVSALYYEPTLKVIIDPTGRASATCHALSLT